MSDGAAARLRTLRQGARDPFPLVGELAPGLVEPMALVRELLPCGVEPLSLLGQCAAFLRHAPLLDARTFRVGGDADELGHRVVKDQVGVVATVTVDQFADADFWCADDDITAALYAHRMAVARRAAGIGLGSAMLDWAAERAERAGRTWLRLDAWSTNGLLHAYYKNLGFEMVRNVPVPGRGSGALFERPSGERHGGGPVLVDLTDVPAGRVEVH